MKNYKRASIEEVNGTSLKTHVEATYGELVTLLGEPEESDGYKVSGEWAVKDRVGNVCTVYDWKRTRLYDFTLPSVEVFRALKYPTTFNIGGHDAFAAENFRHQLELQLLALRTKEIK